VPFPARDDTLNRLAERIARDVVPALLDGEEGVA
jgi:hypothetical protein